MLFVQLERLETLLGKLAVASAPGRHGLRFPWVFHTWPKTLWGFICLFMAHRSLLGLLLPGYVWWGLSYQASGKQLAFSPANFMNV